MPLNAEPTAGQLLARSLLDEYTALQRGGTRQANTRPPLPRTRLGGQQTYWTRARILEALRQWNQRNHNRYPGVAVHWTHANGLPAASTVQRYWRTLMHAWEESLKEEPGEEPGETL